MTSGHKHRTIKVKRGSRVERVLRAPLLHTENLGWVDKSRFVFGPCESNDKRARVGMGPCYTLSLLGILHGLTGLTLEVP